jgi:hypothetical protein
LLSHAVPYCHLPGRIFPFVANARGGARIPATLLRANPLFSAHGPRIYISSYLFVMETGVHGETQLTEPHLTGKAASGGHERARFS